MHQIFMSNLKNHNRSPTTPSKWRQSGPKCNFRFFAPHGRTVTPTGTNETRAKSSQQGTHASINQISVFQIPKKLLTIYEVKKMPALRPPPPPRGSDLRVGHGIGWRGSRSTSRHLICCNQTKNDKVIQEKRFFAFFS